MNISSLDDAYGVDSNTVSLGRNPIAAQELINPPFPQTPPFPRPADCGHPQATHSLPGALPTAPASGVGVRRSYNHNNTAQPAPPAVRTPTTHRLVGARNPRQRFSKRPPAPPLLSTTDNNPPLPHPSPLPATTSTTENRRVGLVVLGIIFFLVVLMGIMGVLIFRNKRKPMAQNPAVALNAPQWMYAPPPTGAPAPTTVPPQPVIHGPPLSVPQFVGNNTLAMPPLSPWHTYAAPNSASITM